MKQKTDEHFGSYFTLQDTPDSEVNHIFIFITSRIFSLCCYYIYFVYPLPLLCLYLLSIHPNILFAVFPSDCMCSFELVLEYVGVSLLSTRFCLCVCGSVKCWHLEKPTRAAITMFSETISTHSTCCSLSQQVCAFQPRVFCGSLLSLCVST